MAEDASGLTRRTLLSTAFGAAGARLCAIIGADLSLVACSGAQQAPAAPSSDMTPVPSPAVTPNPSPSPTPAAPLPKLVFASSNNQMLSATENAAGMTHKIDRWPHYIPEDINEIVFTWRVWRLAQNSDGALLDLPHPVVIESAAAEIEGAVVQLTFDGLQTRTIVSSENDVRSQPLTPDMFGLRTFKGVTVWTRTICNLGGPGNSLPFSPRSTYDTAGSQSGFFDPGATLIDNPLTSGPFRTSGSPVSVRTIGWQPWVLGRPDGQALFRVWIARGDSITSNTGDSTGARDGRGWFQRACSTLGVPCANFAVHASTSLAGSNDPRLSYWYGFATHGVIYYGNNDIGMRNNGSSAVVKTLLGRISVIQDQMRLEGISSVGVVRLGPSAASADSWLTELGQSPFWLLGGAADNFNKLDFIKAGFDFVIANDANRGAGNPYVWFADGATPRLRAHDNGHPSTGGAHALAEEAVKIMRMI